MTTLQDLLERSALIAKEAVTMTTEDATVRALAGLKRHLESGPMIDPVPEWIEALNNYDTLRDHAEAMVEAGGQVLMCPSFADQCPSDRDPEDVIAERNLRASINNFRKDFPPKVDGQ